MSADNLADAMRAVRNANTALEELKTLTDLLLNENDALRLEQSRPLAMVMYCPAGHQHIDEGEWTTRRHKTHQCQENIAEVGDRAVPCGFEWRPMDRPTVGVKA